MSSLPSRDLLARLTYVQRRYELGMWHAWVYDEPIGRFGSMATARDAAEAELGERVHWERHDGGDRWEAWSHRY